MHLDENLRTPYAQNWYIGLQQTMTPSVLLEIGYAGSVGRKLISRDNINRVIQGVRLNNTIGDDTFLSNAGNSNYHALEVGLRRRFSGGLQFQVSYSYSHAIDNQSDVFEGIRTRPGPTLPTLATFTRQFDAQVDRGNANFDQRQNLIFNVVWDLPRTRLSMRPLDFLIRDWSVSVIGAIRSGFPVTVIDSGDSAVGLENNRVDFVGRPEEPVYTSSPTSVPGAVTWLDPNLFRPAFDRVGNLGRGALHGPGFWNYDFAVLRNFGSTDGRLRVQFRAELYNLFNHANLSAPVTQYSYSDFGLAYFGLNRTFSRFGDLPLENSSRRIQFGLRIQF